MKIHEAIGAKDIDQIVYNEYAPGCTAYVEQDFADDHYWTVSFCKDMMPPFKTIRVPLENLAICLSAAPLCIEDGWQVRDKE